MQVDSDESLLTIKNSNFYLIFSIYSLQSPKNTFFFSNINMCMKCKQRKLIAKQTKDEFEENDCTKIYFKKNCKTVVILSVYFLWFVPKL